MFYVDLKIFQYYFPSRQWYFVKNTCHCGIVLQYALEHASIILRLSLSWVKANMAKFYV